MKMMKNSDGKQSASVTFSWISFVWVLAALTVGLIEEFQIGDSVIKFRMLDATIVLALLTPSFGLYGFRRWLDKRFEVPNATPPSNPTPDRKRRRGIDNPDEEDLRK